MKYVLQLNKLVIGHKKRPLSKEISLDILEGDLVQIKGPNGSGKSTLIQTIRKKIKPVSGSFTLNGSVAYLAQYHYTDFAFALSLSEILGLYHIDSQDELVRRLPLHLNWSELSGGMRQRILLATLLSKNPDILFLDEPANHLDGEGVKGLIEALQLIQTEKRVKTIVLISHIDLGLKSHQYKEIIL